MEGFNSYLLGDASPVDAQPPPSRLGSKTSEASPAPRDLSEYLKEQFDIIERSLEAERDASPEELRYALQKIWHERYERRRERYEMPLDEMALPAVNRDVEVLYRCCSASYQRTSIAVRL